MDIQKEFKKLGTHDGRFHADEVVATAILKEIFDIELVRTRDEEILKELDIVYDVGGGEFDHHDVEKQLRDDEIPYAACGLVWRRFGSDVIRFRDPSLEEEDVESAFYYIDRALIRGIDAQDNGMRTGDGDISLMNISQIISGFNPPWYSDKSEDEAFFEAVEVASSILRNTINQRLSVLKSRDIVIDAFENRETPEVMVLDQYCPYGEVLKEIDENNEVLFVIYERKGSYALQTVREWGRRDRKKLPKAWAGKRDTELAEATGVEDAVFCHPGRFIAAANSIEGVMKMAELAVEEPVEERRVKVKTGFFKSLARFIFRR